MTRERLLRLKAALEDGDIYGDLSAAASALNELVEEVERLRGGILAADSLDDARGLLT